MEGTKKKILFQAIAWNSINEQVKKETLHVKDRARDPLEGKFDSVRQENLVIRIFGRTKENENVVVIVKDFKPIIYIGLEDNDTEGDAEEIVKSLENSLSYHKQSIIYKEAIASQNIVFKEIFNEFTAHEKRPMIELRLNNSSCISTIRRKLHENGIFYKKEKKKFNCYNTQFEALSGFFHRTHIKPCGWIEVTYDESKCKREQFIDPLITIKCGYKALKPVNSVETANFLIGSFDIEVVPMIGEVIPDGFSRFPISAASNDGVINACFIFQRFKDDKPLAKFNVIYGECDKLKMEEYKDSINICCKTERELLIAIGKILRDYKPDIMTGYNVYGFDWKYLYDRARRFNCLSQLFEVSKDPTCKYVWSKKKLESSGRGKNTFYYPDIPGIVHMDLLPAIKRDHKLPNYKLNTSAKQFIGQAKLDMPIRELNKLFRRGRSSDLRLIAEYCMRDTELCITLMKKLNLLKGEMAMANACLVPVDYMIFRGMGVKVLSLLGYQCYEDEKIVQDNHVEYESLGKRKAEYTGATVIEPKEIGLSEDVVVLDFTSLYPTNMIAHNMSSDTLVKSKKYMDLPGYKYETISYTDMEGEKTATFVQCDTSTSETKKKTQGVVPAVLDRLLSQRKEFKKLMEEWEKKDKEIASTYDTYQLAAKIAANSVYGLNGARTFALYCKEVAACTTACGRRCLDIAESHTEKNYPFAHVIYGDSVPGYMPVLLRNPLANAIKVVPIKDVFRSSNFTRANNKQYKLRSKDELFTQTWSSNGWTEIKMLIKHKTSKNIYKIASSLGLVEVTEDHSLLTSEGKPLKPKKLELSNPHLLHGFPKDNETSIGTYKINPTTISNMVKELKKILS